jgi:hypothetical protein
MWILTGADACGREPELPEALMEPGWAHFQYAEEWSTHWTRAMENMLHFPHLPYVYQRSTGRQLRASVERNARLELEVEPTSYGMQILARVEGRESAAALSWQRPNGMVLDLSFGGRRMKQHIYCVPVDEKVTRMMLSSTRDFGLFALLAPLYWLLDWSNVWILREDRAVVESSQPPEVPHPSESRASPWTVPPSPSVAGTVANSSRAPVRRSTCPQRASARESARAEQHARHHATTRAGAGVDS